MFSILVIVSQNITTMESVYSEHLWRLSLGMKNSLAEINPCPLESAVHFWELSDFDRFYYVLFYFISLPLQLEEERLPEFRKLMKMMEEQISNILKLIEDQEKDAKAKQRSIDVSNSDLCICTIQICFVLLFSLGLSIQVIKRILPLSYTCIAFCLVFKNLIRDLCTKFRLFRHFVNVSK